MESFFSVQLMVDAAREEQKKQLEYVLVAQRCVGITAHIIENGCIRIRFETSYKGELEWKVYSMHYMTLSNFFLKFAGEYFEPFYLELVFKDDKIKVSAHKIACHMTHTQTHART